MEILWETFQPDHMGSVSVEYFKRVSKNYFVNWGMPQAIGAIDVRHIPIRKPGNTGSRFRNYKGFYSMALQAVVDDNCRYLYIDVGGYGSQSDGGTFKASLFYKALIKKKLNIPSPAKLPGLEVRTPFYFLGDGAYSLMPNLMKPFPGKKRIVRERYFNSILSKSRVSVENAFGYSCQKFNILYKTINKSPVVVEKIIKACCLLHNIIIDKENVNFQKIKIDFSKYNRLRKFKSTDQDFEEEEEDFSEDFELGKKVRDAVADYLLETRE